MQANHRTTAHRERMTHASRSGWSWTRCPDWRERVCRLRSPIYAAIIAAYETDPTDENYHRAAVVTLSLIKMARVRGLLVLDMIRADMPEVAKYLEL